jgi:hypothetical protein
VTFQEQFCHETLLGSLTTCASLVKVANPPEPYPIGNAWICILKTPMGKSGAETPYLNRAKTGESSALMTALAPSPATTVQI